jgi:Asp-tRNA(Asn)/Glu-tRNA(Gln) amidotransferase A subunit family amidase
LINRKILQKEFFNAQEMIDSGNSHYLTGIPYGIKDNILNQGHIASAGSHMLENYTASYNATVIEKLKRNRCNLYWTNEYG